MYTNLNHLMDRYLKKEAHRDELDNEVLLYGYRWARKSQLIGEEDASEFYMKLRKRLPRIYHCFKPEKGCFLAYLSKSFRFQALAILKENQKTHRSDWFHYSLSQEREQSTCTSESFSYGETEDPVQLFWKKLYGLLMKLPAKNRTKYFKRMLCLFLHYAPMISELYYQEAARCCGISEEKFRKYVIGLEKEMEKMQNKQEKLKMQLNNMYVGYKTYEYKESYVTEIERKERARKKKEYFRVRWLSCRNRRQKLNLTICQKEVARVLNIPQGTVGSCIFYARQFLEPLSTVGFSS